MPENPRPHTTPPELAKDILTRLDTARAAVNRARSVAQRGGFSETDGVLARLVGQLEAAITEAETTVRADSRRLLNGG